MSADEFTRSSEPVDLTPYVVKSVALWTEDRGGEMLMSGSKVVTTMVPVNLDLDCTLTDAGVAFFRCQLDHVHDATSCVPTNIVLGTE